MNSLFVTISFLQILSINSQQDSIYEWAQRQGKFEI